MLRLPPLVLSRISSKVKLSSHSTMLSIRIVMFAHIVSPSLEPDEKTTGMVRAMKSPSIPDAAAVFHVSTQIS